MRRLWIVGALIVAPLLLALPAGAAKKPPPADATAQAMCEHSRLIDVQQQYGVSPSSTDYELLIQGLDETRSKGAAVLHKQLFSAPTPEAQASVLPKIARWCSDTLKLRCSAFKCVGGNQVTTITKK